MSGWRTALVCACACALAAARPQGSFFSFFTPLGQEPSTESSTPAESTTVQETVDQTGTPLFQSVEQETTIEIVTSSTQTTEIQEYTESSSPLHQRTTEQTTPTPDQVTTELQRSAATHATLRTSVQESFPTYRPEPHNRSYNPDDCCNEVFGYFDYRRTTTLPPRNIYREPPGSVLNKELVINCYDSSTIPRQYLSRSVQYATVTLVRCHPPRDGSYASWLLEEKVYIGHTLNLLELRPDAVLTAATLAGLGALQRLTLSAAQRRHLPPAAAGTLLPAPGALPGLAALRALRLDCVRPDRVPHQITELYIRQTGLPALWDETVNITVLSIEENRLPWIPAWGNKLQKLILVSETVTLPARPGQLLSLVIRRAEAEYLSARTLQLARRLQHLQLWQLWGRALPAQLLSDQEALRSFLAEDNDFETLPADLFAYSSDLETISLRRNKLQYLPRGLFSGLTKLQQLRLDDNQLSAQVAALLRPARALRDLSLSGNPLGDLCVDDVWQLPNATSLSELRAARTHATRLCSHWLRGARSSLYVDLSDNRLTQLPCSVVDYQRDPSLHGPTLKLDGNPIQQISCTRSDFERAASNKLPHKANRAKISLTSALRCDCAVHWTQRLLRERNTTATFTPRLAADRPCGPLNCS